MTSKPRCLACRCLIVADDTKWQWVQLYRDRRWPRLGPFCTSVCAAQGAQWDHDTMCERVFGSAKAGKGAVAHVAGRDGT